MKLLLILICSFFCFNSFAQYRESGDTIFINNKILLPGDTVHLGLGSDPYKNFLFIKLKPSITNALVSGSTVSIPSLPSSSAFHFLIYKGMQLTGKKAIKYKTGYPTFLLNGYKGPYNTCYIEFPGAIASKELLNF